MADSISFKNIKELLEALQVSFTEKMSKLQEIKQRLATYYWYDEETEGVKDPTLKELVDFCTTNHSPIVTIFKYVSHIELDSIADIKGTELLIESTSLCDLSNFINSVGWTEESPSIFIFDTPSGEEPTAITNLNNAFVAEKHYHFKEIIFNRPIEITDVNNMKSAFRVLGLERLKGNFNVPQIERETFYQNVITGEEMTFVEGCLKADSNFGWFYNLTGNGINNIITGLCENTDNNNKLKLILCFLARDAISNEQRLRIKNKGWTLYWTDGAYREDIDEYFM